ncbi:hypothetical protein G7Y89_g4939 [Cudoniella acicularis]|uniref:Heterokaryon incompatibility domain-containing protein n=1 Tax=Cudoniella acicularis TaxID=354080 RepID=A0A8H4RNG1_9HELO|nr:hypothetical protein G7Y89_g4939 [Cudoniella acicularis]
MDHLPLPEGFQPLEVPYLNDPKCPYVYDNKDMPEFLKRKGHGSTLVLFTFSLGSLSTRTIIYTSTIKETYITGLDSFMSAIQHAYVTAVGYDDLLVLSEVSFSIVILLRTLMLAKLELFPASERPHECKGDVYRFYQRLSSTTLYFISALGQQVPSRDHLSCKGFNFQVTQVTNFIYVPKHVTADRPCKLIMVKEELLNEAVSGGSIPVIFMDDKSNIHVGKVPIAVSKDRSYVALSHIWADGLGNPMGNVIHLCQAKKLQQSANDVATQYWKARRQPRPEVPTLWWMDTLCVPATEEGAKTMTINAMGKVYKNAMAVLVLDAEYGGMAGISLERAVGIAASPWWTRLWTIQEGAFAKEPYFQFRDYACRPSDLILYNTKQDKKYGEDEWNISELLIRDAISASVELSSLQEKLRPMKDDTSSATSDGDSAVDNPTKLFASSFVNGL